MTSAFWYKEGKPAVLGAGDDKPPETCGREICLRLLPLTCALQIILKVISNQLCSRQRPSKRRGGPGELPRVRLRCTRVVSGPVHGPSLSCCVRLGF